MKEKAVAAIRESKGKSEIPERDSKGAKDKDGRRNNKRDKERRRSRSRSGERSRDDRRRVDRGDGRRDDRKRDNRDRDRDRRRRSPSPGQGRDRDRGRRDRDRDRGDRHGRDRDGNGKDRDRRRERSRSRERDGNGRDRDRGDRDEDRAPAPAEEYKGGVVTLKQVKDANPTMGMQEAVQKMSMINSAVAQGSPPIPIVGSIYSKLAPGETPAAPAAAALGASAVSIPKVSGGTGVNSYHINATIHREIYIGNVPHISSEELKDVLNSGLQQLGEVSQMAHGNVSPCVSAWVNEGQKRFAFAEFRSVEECNAVVSMLSGMTVQGYTLKMGRPKGYVNPTQFQGSQYNAQTCLLTPTGKDITFIAQQMQQQKQQQMQAAVPPPPTSAPPVQSTNVAAMLAQALGKPNSAGPAPPAQQQHFSHPIEAPTEQCIRLVNMVSQEDFQDEEMYAELIDDVSDECGNYGKVVRVVVPRPPAHNVKDWTADGVGEVFVLFDNSQAATIALKAVHGRSFANRVIQGSFFPIQLVKDGVYKVTSQPAPPVAVPPPPQVAAKSADVDMD